MTAPSATALVLAAGAGTRMKSTLSKVLQPILGRPMAGWTLAAAREAGMDSVVVTHHQEDQVRSGLAGEGIRFVRQETLRGTGDAVASGLAELPKEGVVVVLYGDCPAIRGETLRRVLAAHQPGTLATVVTAHAPDPTGYGRLVRDTDGRPQRVVEQKECTPEQAALTEVNVGLYALDLAWVRATLPTLKPHSHKGEIYLTDLVEEAAKEGGLVVLLHDDIDEMMGVNDKWMLCEARRLLQARILEHHARQGVTFENPSTNLVEHGVQIGPDATLEPGVVLRGRTRIGANTVVGAHSVVTDSDVGDSVLVKPHSVLEEARVATGAQVGPFARLRPQTDVQEGAKVGNFVEVKKATLEPGAKVSHLSYIGDARVGARANVGAGTITCNYDGHFKHKTDIGAGAFIGSNTALVAPVSIGDGAMVGAGSTITKDVEPDALALARGRQTARPGWAALYREVKAAETASESDPSSS